MKDPMVPIIGRMVGKGSSGSEELKDTWAMIPESVLLVWRGIASIEFCLESELS